MISLCIIAQSKSTIFYSHWSTETKSFIFSTKYVILHTKKRSHLILVLFVCHCLAALCIIMIDTHTRTQIQVLVGGKLLQRKSSSMLTLRVARVDGSYLACSGTPCPKLLKTFVPCVREKRAWGKAASHYITRDPSSIVLFPILCYRVETLPMVMVGVVKVFMVKSLQMR